jgi:hypothetical protein
MQKIPLKFSHCEEALADVAISNAEALRTFLMDYRPSTVDLI